MALEKCPRCELNYILDGGELCTVCRMEVRGEYETIDIPEMCPECGENPVAPGNDLCVFCRNEMKRRNSASNGSEDTIMTPENMVEIDSVSTMDEIELDIDKDMADEFGASDEFKDDIEEDMEESDMLSIDAMAEAEDEDDIEEDE